MDSGIDYEVSLANISMNRWVSQQSESELRQWQKDIVLAMMIDTFGPIDKFLIYQRGHGYNQDHDLCLSRSQNHNFWCLSTEHDFWITRQDGREIIFDRRDSMGSILNRHDRHRIYDLFDQAKSQYNPLNLMLTRI
jgi:hypothetical protein